MKKLKNQKNYLLNQLLGKPVANYQKFNESLKLDKMTTADGNRDPYKWPNEWKTIYHKSYGRFEEIILPKPNLNTKISFNSVLSKRKSVREFAKTPIKLDKLSNLLYYASG